MRTQSVPDCTSILTFWVFKIREFYKTVDTGICSCRGCCCLKKNALLFAWFVNFMLKHLMVVMNVGMSVLSSLKRLFCLIAGLSRSSRPDENISISQGDTVWLQCRISVTPPHAKPRYEWERDKTKLPPDSRYEKVEKIFDTKLPH